MLRTSTLLYWISCKSNKFYSYNLDHGMRAHGAPHVCVIGSLETTCCHISTYYTVLHPHTLGFIAFYKDRTANCTDTLQNVSLQYLPYCT